jgi:hypothetical protein
LRKRASIMIALIKNFNREKEENENMVNGRDELGGVR